MIRNDSIILKVGTYDITIDNITRLIKSVVTHKYDEFIENSYSEIDKINRTKAVNILTIENQIEFVHTEQIARIVQREIGTHVKSFADETKKAMNQDTDVVLIDELQDYETISNAMSIAETGHLIVAAVQSDSVIDAIERLMELFPHEKQYQIRMRLNSVSCGIVHQKRGLIFADSKPTVEIFTGDALTDMIMQNDKVRDRLYQAR